jgi:hypothetical protein
LADFAGHAALAKLRDPADTALAGLIELAVDEALRVRLREAVDSAKLADRLTAAVSAAASDPGLRDRLLARLTQERARWRAERHSARHWVLPPVEAPLRHFLAQPWSPSEKLALRVSDHPAVRAMLKDVLSGTLARFAGGLKALDGGVLGGLGGRVARRGAGLFGGLGDLAGGIVGAVKDEFESAVEARVKESVGQATEEAIRAIAAWAADPKQAAALAALRVSILEVALDTPLGDLVGELDEVPDAAIVDAVLQGLKDASARASLRADLLQVLDEAVASWGDESLGALADDLGLRSHVVDALTELGTTHARTLVSSEAFATWWTQLHS